MVFSGKRVLVVEDEMLVALGLEDNLKSLGCVVIGPVSNLAQAMHVAETVSADAAILDVNLRGEYVYPAAAILADRGIPFMFCSGFSGSMPFPDRFSGVTRVAKPYTSRIIADALAVLLRQSSATDDTYMLPVRRGDSHV